MYGGDFAFVDNGQFHSKDTDSWIYLTMQSVQVADFENIKVSFRLRRYG